jgi:lysophospholipase L1-like esterase
MKEFIAECGVKSILLIAPPTMKRGAWVTDDAVVVQSLELSQQYRRLAEETDILFADADEWEIELTFDGVHFTEEGHARFADKLAELLGKSSV